MADGFLHVAFVNPISLSEQPHEAYLPRLRQLQVGTPQQCRLVSSFYLATIFRKTVVNPLLDDRGISVRKVRSNIHDVGTAPPDGLESTGDQFLEGSFENTYGLALHTLSSLVQSGVVFVVEKKAIRAFPKNQVKILGLLVVNHYCCRCMDQTEEKQCKSYTVITWKTLKLVWKRSTRRRLRKLTWCCLPGSAVMTTLCTSTWSMPKPHPSRSGLCTACSALH